MLKSSRRDRSEGAMDKIGGRVMEIVGKLTGRTSHKAKGKAARARGAGRSGKGRAKSAAGKGTGASRHAARR
jgi:uncharacterized protein YjbJ (UPF0337 family)